MFSFFKSALGVAIILGTFIYILSTFGKNPIPTLKAPHAAADTASDFLTHREGFVRRFGSNALSNLRDANARTRIQVTKGPVITPTITNPTTEDITYTVDKKKVTLKPGESFSLNIRANSQGKFVDEVIIPMYMHTSRKTVTYHFHPNTGDLELKE
ncbi:hypothetical protein H0W32_01360 [Patescibacteria group bacterium]|nr:hypothetical protein [Patescibacteria group bacterium]